MAGGLERLKARRSITSFPPDYVGLKLSTFSAQRPVTAGRCSPASNSPAAFLPRLYTPIALILRVRATRTVGTSFPCCRSDVLRWQTKRQSL